MKHLELSLLVFASVSYAPVASSASEPSPSTQLLLDANPGMRAMFDGERMIALYGTSFATDGDPGTTTDDFVGSFLSSNADALGVESVTLILKNKINIRNDKFTVYTYEQELEGLPVYGSIVKIPVLLGTTEKIAYAGMHLMQAPQSPLPVDFITAAQAIDTVAQSTTHGHLTNFTSPAKVVFEGDDGELHRTWSFAGYDADESYHFFIDTNSGGLVGIQNTVLNADVWGTVSGYATPCCAPSPDPDDPAYRFCPDVLQLCPADDPMNCPDPSVECPTDEPSSSCCCGSDDPGNACTPGPFALPLAGVQVSVYGNASCASGPETGDLLGQTFADENGDYSFSGITAPVAVVTKLIGDSLTVLNCDARADCVGEELLECADVPVGASPVDFAFNSVPEEFATAQVNAFAVGQATHDWFKGLQPTFAQIDQPLEVHANAMLSFPSSSCNANYRPVTKQIILGYGPGECNNAAFSTLLSHEYGHFIVIEIIPLLTHNRQFHEGAADAITGLMWSTECVGFGLGLLGIEGCLRNFDEPDIQLSECPESAEGGYVCGLALAGAVWDTRKNLIERFANDPDPEASAKAVIDSLFADFLFVTDGIMDQSILIEMLIADDADGNLSNGTPHQSEILSGFLQHGWSDPMDCDVSNSVTVTWVGPPAEPGPQQGIDYVVHCDVEPPSVTLLTTEKDGIIVSRWSIGRTLGGSHNFGVVTANWASPSNHDIIVEVGTIPIAPCADVNVIHIPAQSDANWSSIVLELGGDLRNRAQCDPVTQEGASLGNGGRISGWIGGHAGLVSATAVGVGGLQPGTLEVGGSVQEITLGAVPTGSTLIAGRVARPLVVAGELRGRIDIGTLQSVPNALVLQDHGSIHIQGTGVSDGDIEINGSLAGAEITIDGPYAGRMTVSSMQEETWEDDTSAPLIQTGDLTGTITVSSLTAGTIEIGTLQAGAYVGASGLIEVETFLADDARIVVHGDVAKTGRVSILGGSIGADATIEIEGDFLGSLDIGTRLKTPPGIVADIAGQVIIGGSLSGPFDHHGLLEQGGEITIEGDITTGGTYSQTIDDPEREWAGSLAVAGDVLGSIGLESDVLLGVITVGAYLEGGIELDQSLVGGGLHVGADLGGSIAVDGSVLSGGGIYVDGRLGKGSISVGNMESGVISIGEDTDMSSLIHLGGFNNGSILINAKEGNFDANGDILVGTVKVPLKLPDIAFDGCVRVYDDGAGQGGTLNGNITVVGCLDPYELNICVDGPIKGNIVIHQDNCPNNVGWACQGCGAP